MEEQCIVVRPDLCVVLDSRFLVFYSVSCIGFCCGQEWEDGCRWVTSCNQSVVELTKFVVDI